MNYTLINNYIDLIIGIGIPTIACVALYWGAKLISAARQYGWLIGKLIGKPKHLPKPVPERAEQVIADALDGMIRRREIEDEIKSRSTL